MLTKQTIAQQIGFQVAHSFEGQDEEDVVQEGEAGGEQDALVPGNQGLPPARPTDPEKQPLSIRMKEFRFWARAAALGIGCLAYLIGAIVCFATPNNIMLGIGIYCLLISIPIFVIEAGFFNMVIPSATLHKILHSYYTRAISYALLSVPGFVYLPTLFGSLGLVASGVLYGIAAFRKEDKENNGVVDFSGIV